MLMQSSLKKVLFGALFFVASCVIAIIGYTLAGWTVLEALYMVTIWVQVRRSPGSAPAYDVETAAMAEKLRLIAEMPLADDAGGVALLLQKLGDGDFIGVEAFGIAGEENVGNAERALGVTAGHQRRSRG